MSPLFLVQRVASYVIAVILKNFVFGRLYPGEILDASGKRREKTEIFAYQ